MCVCGGVGTLVVLQGSVCVCVCGGVCVSFYKVVCVWRGRYLCSFTR